MTRLKLTTTPFSTPTKFLNRQMERRLLLHVLEMSRSQISYVARLNLRCLEKSPPRIFTVHSTPSPSIRRRGISCGRRWSNTGSKGFFVTLLILVRCMNVTRRIWSFLIVWSRCRLGNFRQRRNSTISLSSSRIKMSKASIEDWARLNFRNTC